MQCVLTRHLLAAAGLKAYEGHGGSGELKIIAAILERPVHSTPEDSGSTLISMPIEIQAKRRVPAKSA